MHYLCVTSLSDSDTVDVEMGITMKKKDAAVELMRHNNKSSIDSMRRKGDEWMAEHADLVDADERGYTNDEIILSSIFERTSNKVHAKIGNIEIKTDNFRDFARLIAVCILAIFLYLKLDDKGLIPAFLSMNDTAEAPATLIANGVDHSTPEG